MAELRFRLRIFLAVMLAVMVLGTVGFMLAENLTLSDAFYFSVVTVTTVGYGDIHPATPLGKVLAMVLILGGVGTFMGVVANGTEMLLSRRDQDMRLSKLYMVMGIFFSELGTPFLRACSGADPRAADLAALLAVNGKWTGREFADMGRRLGEHPFRIEVAAVDFAAMADLLRRQGDLLLRLVENPFLVENEGFSEALLAVFHMRDELCHRPSLHDLSQADYLHLRVDLQRAYRLLAAQWLKYVAHLKERYPYLFLTAVRTNPFVGPGPD